MHKTRNEEIEAVREAEEFVASLARKVVSRLAMSIKARRALLAVPKGPGCCFACSQLPWTLF